jgi:polyvinyl alcohol dehydrogenase (cytochrome)
MFGPCSLSGLCSALLCASFALLMPFRASAADADGNSIYQVHCAICHEASSVTRAPARPALGAMSPENIMRALETGIMREQGSSLTPGEKQTVAEFLSGKTIGQAKPQAALGLCPSGAGTHWIASGPSWNGWGVDSNNSRFQTTENAGLTAAETPRLKLKWAFAFPDTAVANGQPTVFGGRVFVPSANRHVYSLDAKSGCQYWSFETEAPVRSATNIQPIQGKLVAFFGDRRSNAYAVEASSGKLIWKTRVDDQPRGGITAAMAYYDGRLYVPIADAEEGAAVDIKYECCRGRGALIALDAATGTVIWKTYTEPPAQKQGKNQAGTQLWGPSGASIWSAPTLDVEHKRIYAGTGDNFSEPPTTTSDAILAFDMQTGGIVWSKQLTQGDAYTVGCRMTDKQGCPDSDGPDFDIGASPILVRLASGRRVLLVSQKSGIARALDPDKNGRELWQYRVGKGSPLGGIQWGSASDGQNMYVANSDISFTKPSFERGERRVLDPKPGGGLFAISIATGEKIWAAAPPDCHDRVFCSPAQSAAVTVMPGVAFSGSVDGHIRGYSTRDGKVIWDFDTERDYRAVNGVPGKGGSIDCPGPVVVEGMLYVESGYGSFAGVPGNVLLAFSVDGN